MTDIVERLRKPAGSGGFAFINTQMHEAADEIERLRASLDALKEQEPVGWFNQWNSYNGYQQVADEYNGAPGTIPLYAAPVPAVNASALIDALEEIQSQANGHKRSTASNGGVNIALENIEAIARAVLASRSRNHMKHEPVV